MPAPRSGSLEVADTLKCGAVTAGRHLLVVDDDPFTRSVLGPALSTRGWEVRMCASAAAAMQEAARQPINIALIDLDLGPGPDGVDLANALRREFPLLPIVILTSYQSPQLLDIAHTTLPMGVRYLMKSQVENLDDLDAELATAARHPFDVTAKRRATVVTETGVRLSSGQLEIMRLVATGHGNAEIAQQVGKSETTVEKAVARLIRQLGLDNDPRRNKRVLVAEVYYRLTQQRRDGNGRTDSR